MKKYIKVFLFSFILFCSIFFINSVSAMTFDDIYADIENAASNDYYGETIERVKTACPDRLFFPTKEKLSSLINASTHSKKDAFLNKLSTADKYFILSNPYDGGSRRISLVVFNDSDNYNYHFQSKISGSYDDLSIGKKNLMSLQYINNNFILCNYDTFCIDDGSNWNTGVSYQASLNNSFIFSNTDVYCNYFNYSNPGTFQVNEHTTNDFNIPSLTVIDNPNSDVIITYEYNQDYSSCHVDATIRNGAFSDKLYYSYQMPSISGQGLTIGKTAFPSRRYRYNK